jgi:hypothetical protein
MKKLPRFSFLLCFILALSTLSGCARENAATDKIDAAQLKTAMDDAAQYLVRATKPSGEYIYLDNLKKGKPSKPSYNVLRHAGAIHVLADYYSYKKDPQVKDALVRASHFLVKRYVKPIQNDPHVLGVWSLPSDHDGDSSMQIKLGGIGLGLVGLAQTEKFIPGTTSMETLRGIGNGALWLQEKDGSFYSKYNPMHGKDARWDSLYYPGETALGLAMLAEVDPDPAYKKRWLNAAFRAIGYMARTRIEAKDIPVDHWVLIATARLWPYYAYSDRSVSKAEMIRQAAQICRVIVADPALRETRTTPIATRVEGMNAALTFLPPEENELREIIKTEIAQGVQFLLTTQVQEGRMKGAIPHAVAGTDGKVTDPNADDVRIDYIQHALSAWLEYSRQNGIIPKNAVP